MLHVGSNDVLNGGDPISIAHGILSLQAQIGAVVPAPRLLMALIPTRYDFSGPTPQLYADFESRRKNLSALIAQNSSYDYPCTARDLPHMSVLDSGDFTSAPATRTRYLLASRRAAFQRHVAQRCTLQPAHLHLFGRPGSLRVRYTRRTRQERRPSRVDHGLWPLLRLRRQHESVAGIGLAQRLNALRSDLRLQPRTDPFCTFDTRSFVQYPGSPYLEAITAYGRSWNLNANTGALVESSTLAANPRYKRAHDRIFHNGFE